MAERIGVLLVHGIGSQKPNEHLIGEAHRIVAALGEDAEITAINVVGEPAIASEIPHKFFPNYAQNTVCVEATAKSGKQFIFEFNEVYWAELGEASSLARQIKFWFWALSMWSVAGRETSILDGFKSHMYIPKGDGFRAIYRLQLAFLGALFLLGVGTVGVWNVIADRFKLPRVYISGLLTDYVGDVMLYGQPSRDADPTVGEMGEPPRAEIRGRMVDLMAEFAMREYDRWYVVAHSLGTVVAYNGLMETEMALPNYLSEARWREIKARKPGLVTTLAEPLPDLMLPRRPTWLADNEGISRRALFAKLQGFVTYGPAIGKFHGIWPIMVPCNRDEFVFQENFKWVNIYDQLDPVAGPLLGYTTQFFGPWAGNGQTPKDTDLVQIAPGGKKWSAAKIAPKANISYSAGKVWLLAHLGYLTHPSAAYKQAGYAVFSLAKWLRTGIFPANEFEALDVGAWGGLWRWLVAQLQLIGIAIAVWLLAARIAWKAADKYALPYVHFDWIYCAFAAFIAAFSINYLIECFARIPPPPRMERVLYVTAAAFAGWHLDTALKVFPALMPAIAGGVIAGYLASLGLDFLSLRSLRWRIPSNRRRWVIAWGFAILSALVGCILYFSFGSWLVRQMTAVRGHFEHHSLQLFSLDVLSLTIVLIVLLGVCRWLFQPIPVRS